MYARAGKPQIGKLRRQCGGYANKTQSTGAQYSLNTGAELNMEKI